MFYSYNAQTWNFFNTIFEEFYLKGLLLYVLVGGVDGCALLSAHIRNCGPFTEPLYLYLYFKSLRSLYFILRPYDFIVNDNM